MYLVEEAGKLIGPLELTPAMNVVDNAALMVNKLEQEEVTNLMLTLRNVS